MKPDFGVKRDSHGTPWRRYVDEKTVWYPLRQSLPSLSSRVLDLGCGDGHIAISLADKGFRAIGVDLRGGVGPRILARAESLPFKPASFDLVLLVLVLMHVRSPERMISEVRRVLKIGGRLLVVVGNRQSFTGLAIREQSRRFLLKRIPYEYYRSYSKRELEKLLTLGGFTIRTIRSVTFVPNLVSKGPPDVIRRTLAIAHFVENALERIPFVRWFGIRLFAVAEATGA